MSFGILGLGLSMKLLVFAMPFAGFIFLAAFVGRLVRAGGEAAH